MGGGRRLVSLRVLALALAIVVVLLVAITLVPALAADSGRADHVARGVHALGRDFSGLKSDEVAPALKIASDEFAHRTFRVRYGDAQLSLTPDDIGARVDVPATARAIVDAGRDREFADLLGSLVGRYRRRAVPPILAVDDKQFDAVLGKFAASVNRPAQDAELVVAAKGITLHPARVGLQVDLTETKQRTLEHLRVGAPGEVTAVAKEVSPAIGDSGWQQAADLAGRILAAPITLRQAQRTWIIEVADLAKLIMPQRSSDSSGAGVLNWDEKALYSYLAGIAREIDIPAREARVVWQNGKFQVVDGVAGQQVDLSATIAAIETAGRGSVREVPVTVVTVPPPIAAKDWNEAITIGNQAVGSPLKLTLGDKTWPISGAELATMITYTVTQDTGPRHSVTIDRERLTDYVTALAKEIDRPAREPLFKLRGGKVSLVEEGQEGRNVDVASTVAAIYRQVFSDQRSVPLSVAVAKPKLSLSDAQNASFPDLIMDATTSLAGAIPEKIHNIQLAAGRISGTLVPPGATFSFNESVGPTTIAAGYQVGYGITLQGGQAVTVPSAAGGICQVATTVFHAAFWAGFPIVQRQSHLYWIERYGQPPRGMRGLDATVDDPYLDFKFRNSSSGWLLVEAAAGGSELRFVLRGIKPDWQVKVEPTVIGNVVKASQATVRQEDPTMPVGRELWVEHAEDGFTSSVRRAVVKGDQVIDALDVTSYYRPSQNVLLVGTKGLTPVPTATTVVTPSVTITSSITTTATVPTQTPRPQ